MFRYVGFVFDSNSAEPSASVKDWGQRLGSDGGWRSALSAGGLQLWVYRGGSPLSVELLAGDGGAGAVLGEVYLREMDALVAGPSQKAVFNDDASRRVLDTRGRWLVHRYWGNYVALLHYPKSRELLLIKDPCGPLPCHWGYCRGVQVIFSHFSDYRDFQNHGLRVNWDFVRSRVANGIFAMGADPWIGVSSVHRGEAVALDLRGAQASRQCYWHPRTFEGAEDWILDADLAAGALFATVRNAVHTLSGPHRNVLQQVSGGLDSSIVLSAVRDSPHLPRVICYTAFTEGMPCDERRWARMAVAGKHPHIEWESDVDRVDLAALPPLAPTVYPSSTLTQWHNGPLERQLSRECGASAVFTGDGGDSVFCASSYAFAADHALRRTGLSRRTMVTGLNVAKRHDSTLWRVLGRALKRRWVGNPMSAYLQVMSRGRKLVTREAREKDMHFPNPWFNQDCSVDLESIWRLGPLAFPPQFYDLTIPPAGHAPLTVSPLCAQPVFELCQRIPVDLHFEAGRIRGLARRAFRGQVPEPILQRQWKDRPVSAPAIIVRNNLEFIRERLLDGQLVCARILDRAALEIALREEPNRYPAIASEILSHLDVELWLHDSGCG